MTAEEAKKLLPVITAYAEGKRIQYSNGGAWIDSDDLSFCMDPSRYRIKPEEPQGGEIVAGEDLQYSNIAKVVSGVARRVDNTDWENTFFVQEYIANGQRAVAVPVRKGEIRPVLKPAPPPSLAYKPYVPRIDGKLDLDWIQSQAREFADEPAMIPKARDMGHCLLAVIDELRWATVKPEPGDPVSDGNWELYGKSKTRIGVGAIAVCLGGSDWYASHAAGGPIGSLIPYTSLDQLSPGDMVELNETTRQIRKAVAKPAVSDGNHDGFDPVNRPRHYADGSHGYECIQFAELLGDGRLFNAFKYIWRQGKKGDATEDIRKSIWYLRRWLLNGPYDPEPDDLNIYKVIYGMPVPVAEAMRLIWSTTSNRCFEEDEKAVWEALKMLEAYVGDSKEVAK